MSCGTRIDGRYGSYFEREEIASKLEREGEYRLADSVKHGDCLDSMDLWRAEDALDRQGVSKYYDYQEERCHCSTDDDY